MTDDIRASYSSEPSTWERGGHWDIQWKWIWEDAPTEEMERKLYEGAWIYVNLEPWSTSVYDPLSEFPNMYIAFAILGEAVWDAYDGHFLSEHLLDSNPPDILKGKAKEFLENYGPPISASSLRNSPIDVRYLWIRSLHTMFRQAQLMKLALSYHQVVIEGSEELLQALDAMGKEVQEDSSVLWPALEQNSELKVLKEIEIFLEDQSHRDLSQGGLKVVPERVPNADQPSSWKFTAHYGHLINVLWYQMHQVMVRKSLVRVCRNERCPEPGRLFVADRPNKWFCSLLCRNTHNVWNSRQRGRPGTVGASPTIKETW